MRWNCPPTAAASDFTASVLARPGTPSTRRWPPDSRAIAIRSSSMSWPTMVRLTSNSTLSSGFVELAGLICPLRVVRRSYLRSVPGPGGASAAERGADGHREPDSGEGVLVCRVDDRDDNADDQASFVEQRAAGASGVDRRVELDEPGVGAVGGLRGPVEAGDHAGGHAVGQAERVPDRDRPRPDVGTAAEGRRYDDLRQRCRGEHRDVRLGIGGDDGRRRGGAVEERDLDPGGAGDDMVRCDD